MTITPVAAAPAPAGGAAPAESGAGSLFTDLLGSPAGAPDGRATLPGGPAAEAAAGLPAGQGARPDGAPTGEPAVDDAVNGAAGELSAAQLVVAAQVVPVLPLLAESAAGGRDESAAGAAPGPGVGTPIGPAAPLPALEGQVPGAPAERAGAVGASFEAAGAVGASFEAAGAVGAPAEAAGVVGAPAKRAGVAEPAGVPAAPAAAADGPAADHASPASPQPTQAAPAPGAFAQSASEHHGGRPGGHHGEQERPSSGVTPLGSLGVTAGQPAATVAAPAREQAATGAVTGQVFPEIGRLVSRGDGTRRITIKLSPEALGDVRVVLTVRNGEVHVRMTGGEAAEQALRAGAPELHRLLELTGASSTQVVVGDHGSATDGRSARGGGFDLGQPGPQDHRPAGTRGGDTSATDGTPRQEQPPLPRPTTRTPLGVDVTM